MKNREIVFIVKMRDNAKAALKGLGGSFVDMARKVRAAADEKRRLAASMDRTGMAAMNLQQALASVAAVLSAGAIVKAASDWGGYANKLRQVTEDEETMMQMREKLYEVSQRSLAPLEGAVNLYSRASVALTKYGASGDDVLRFTETFSKALTLGGASGGEAASATLQFSQALASGTLRGEEFNAVNEASQRTMRVLADYLGKDTGELRKMAMEGKITGKVMYEAFMAAGTQIDAEFSKITLTFDQMMTQAGNAFTRFIGRIDDATGIQKGFADAFKVFINDILPQMERGFLAFIEVVKPAFGAILTGIQDIWGFVTGTLVPAFMSVIDTIVDIGDAFGLIDRYDRLGSLTEGLVKIAEIATVGIAAFVGFSAVVGVVTAAVGLLTGGVSTLWAVIAANPIGAIVTVLSAAVGVLYSFRDATVEVGGQTATVGQLVKATWDFIVEQTGVLVHNVGGTWAVLWRQMELRVAYAVEAMLGYLNGVGETIAEVAAAAGAAFTLNFDAAGDAMERAGKRFGNVSSVSEGKLKDLAKMLDEAGNGFELKPDVKFEDVLTKVKIMDYLDGLLKDVGKPEVKATVALSDAPDDKKKIEEGLSEQERKKREEQRKKEDQEAQRLAKEANEAFKREMQSRERYVSAVVAAMDSLRDKFLPLNAKQQEYAALQKQLTEIDQARTMGLGQYEEALKRAALTEEEVARLRERVNLETKAGKTIYDEIRLAALRYVEETEDGMSLMSKMASSAIGSMASAFEQFVMTGKLNFKGLVSSILADLAKLAAQNAFKQLLSIMSGGQGGGGGDIFSMIGAAIFGQSAPTKHTGGIVGGPSTGRTKVHPMVWAGAQKYHTGGIVGSGLKSGERAIIAKDDEAVMPTVRLPDGSFGVKATGMGGGGGQVVNFAPVIQITVEKADNADQAQRQGEIISREVEEGLRSMVREEIYRSAQPGGVANWRP